MVIEDNQLAIQLDSWAPSSLTVGTKRSESGNERKSTDEECNACHNIKRIFCRLQTRDSIPPLGDIFLNTTRGTSYAES